MKISFFSIQFLNLPVFPENDFNDPEPIEVIIGNGVPRSCTNIMTRDDDIYEDDESFFVTLSSQYENIAFPVSSASVLIVENDGNFDVLLLRQLLSHDIVTPDYLQK